MDAASLDASNQVVGWLLEPGEPSLRYRTLVELLQKPTGDPEVRQAAALIATSTPVQSVLAKMHPDGYWLQKVPHAKRVVGDGVEYGSFASTHFRLAYLAELGLDRSHPLVERAAERYLSLQQPDGDWWLHLSCLIGYNIRTFTLLGYKDDPRLKRSVDLLLNTERMDGGYLCEMHEGKHKTRATKSCIRGSVKALLAFAELPDLWDHPRCKQLVEYFLTRGGIYRSKKPDQLVNQDMARWSFPIIWRTNVWEILYALSKMGIGKDERLQRAWDVLDAKANQDGRYILDWTPAQCPWKVGARGAENKWLTFYVLLCRRLSWNR